MNIPHFVRSKSQREKLSYKRGVGQKMTKADEGVGVGGTPFLVLNEYFFELNPRKNPVLNNFFELNQRKNPVLNNIFELNFLRNPKMDIFLN